MLPVTLFLAKLIGSLLLIVSATMALRKSALVATSERIIRDPDMVFLTGIMTVPQDSRSLSAMTSGQAERFRSSSL